MRRAAALLVVFAALALPGGAQGNGDPASDVLLTTQVFLPFEAPISDSAATELKQTVAAANEKGYTIRVAVIAFTGDLGTAVSLWRRPQHYSKFLGSEIAFVYKGPLLIAMPSGFGFYNGRKPKPVARELGVLAKVKPGKTPTPLAESAAEAVRALAASAGVTVPKPSSGGSATRDRLILAAAVLAFLLVLFFPTRLLRRRRAQGAKRASAGNSTPEPD